MIGTRKATNSEKTAYKGILYAHEKMAEKGQYLYVLLWGIHLIFAALLFYAGTILPFLGPRPVLFRHHGRADASECHYYLDVYRIDVECRQFIDGDLQ
jgi:hypothetical protein